MRFRWLRRIFGRGGATRYNVDARGADPASAQRIDAAMRETERRTLARVRRELDRGHDR